MLPRRRLPGAVVDSDDEVQVDGDGRGGNVAGAEVEGKNYNFDDAIAFLKWK